MGSGIVSRLTQWLGLSRDSGPATTSTSGDADIISPRDSGVLVEGDAAVATPAVIGTGDGGVATPTDLRSSATQDPEGGSSGDDGGTGGDGGGTEGQEPTGGDPPPQDFTSALDGSSLSSSATQDLIEYERPPAETFLADDRGISSGEDGTSTAFVEDVAPDSVIEIGGGSGSVLDNTSFSTSATQDPQGGSGEGDPTSGQGPGTGQEPGDDTTGQVSFADGGSVVDIGAFESSSQDPQGGEDPTDKPGTGDDGPGEGQPTGGGQGDALSTDAFGPDEPSSTLLDLDGGTPLTDASQLDLPDLESAGDAIDLGDALQP